MKRFTALLLVFVLLFSGCSVVKNNRNEKIKITATIFPQYDFLRQITKGADVIINMLIPPGKEVHGFEATLEDVSLVGESDLFVYVGGEDDEWVKNIPESDGVRVSLTDIVKSESDDHIWTSPINTIKIVEALSNTLCEIDPDQATIYQKNTAAYVEELKKLDNDFKLCVASSNNKTLVFAERFPFSSFAKEYSLNYCSAFDSCSTETEAGIKIINELVEIIKKEQISVVFTIEFSDSVVPQTISEETGAKVLQMHSCHNVTQDEFDSGATYISLMRKNLENLKTALN